MKRSIFATLLIGLSLLSGQLTTAAEPMGRLISQTNAQRHGLRRAWFTQVRLNPGRGRLNHLRFFEGTDQLPNTLIAQTDQGVVHVIDAETGQTLWVRNVGSRAHPTMAVGANDKLVGVLNGTKLYLLDRSNGRLLWQRSVSGIPAAGPVLTNHYAFVPALNGQILAYEIKEKKYENEDEDDVPKLSSLSENEGKTDLNSSPETVPVALSKTTKRQGPLSLEYESVYPLICVSFGQVACQPIFLLEDQKNQYLAWSTNKGLFVGYVDMQRQNEFSVKYQLRTHSEIVTQPMYLPPADNSEGAEGLIFAASKLGHIYAISSTRGTERWNYALGQPIVEPVIPIGDRVYATTQLGRFFCLDAKTGDEHWSTSGVGKFIAATKNKIYVADRFGQIRVLDAQSGTTIDGLFAASSPMKFRNIWTDRIYLASPTGLVQCLRETAQNEPLYHRKPGSAPAEATGEEFVPAQPAKPKEKPAETTEPLGSDPFDTSGSGSDSPFE